MSDISFELEFMVAKLKALTGMLEKVAAEVEDLRARVEAKDNIYGTSKGTEIEALPGKPIPRLNIRKLEYLADTWTQGSLQNLNTFQINTVLGFYPNSDDEGEIEWAFKYYGVSCKIWSRGSGASTGMFPAESFLFYGPRSVFVKLFGEGNVTGGAQ